MAEQIHFPYGNAFIVGTPNIEKFSDRLYQEERQKHLYRQKRNKMLDDEFSRNLSGVRDSDIGDLTKAYGDFKMSHMALQKKKGQVTPQDQLELLRKKANVYEVINGSKQEKEWEEAQGKQIMTDKKGYYADDAHEQLIQRRKTPLSKLDKSKDANLLYQYYEPNLDKQLKEARGTEVEVPVKIGQSKTDPLKDDKEVYKAGNTPDKFANSLLEGVMTSNQGRNFSGIMNHKYTDEEFQDLTNRYAAKVNDPKFIAVYGEPKPLPAPDTDLGRAVAIRTMEEYANKQIKPIRMISEINADRALKARQQFAVEQQKRGAKFAMDRVYAIAGLKRTTENEDDMKGISAILNNTKTIIDNGKPVKGQFGQEIPELVEVSDIDVLNTAKNIKDAPISKITFDKNKDQFNIEYDGWMDTQNNFHPAETIPLSKQDYLRIKVDKMNPKNKGNTNAILDKIISDNKGLYPAIQKAFAPETPTQTHTKTTTSEFSKIPMGADVMIKVNGKVMKGKKSDLQKLDNAKIKYEIIK